MDLSPPLRPRKPYYTVVSVVHRQPGSRPRHAPNQHQIGKTPDSIYRRSQVHQPVAGPSRQITRVGPPTRRLPDRPEPRLRPVAERNPPRPPPPHPGVATLEARMSAYETKTNALVSENQKLRDELAATRNELTTALTRVAATERGLRDIERLESRLDDTRDEYDRLSNLLTGDNLFNSEKFHATIQSEVKSGIGYYWPSLKTDMKDQLWKELPPPVKRYVEKEKNKLTDEIVLIRSALVSLQQKSTAGGDVQDYAPAIAELKNAVERIEKKQTEFERALLVSSPTAPRLNSTLLQSGFTDHRLSDPLAVSLPNLPPKPSSPWSENPRHSPQQRRGGEMSPAAPDQCSHPFRQGPDDEANVPTQDPRRSAPTSRSSSALPTNSPDSPYPGSNPSKFATFHTVHEEISPSNSAPPTPTIPQPFHGVHPPRVAQLEKNGSSPVITNPEPPVITTLSPRPRSSTPVQPTSMSRSQSTSVPTRPPAGIHPDRIALLAYHNQPSSAVTSTQHLPHATPDGSQQRLPLEELLADRSQSLPVFFSGANAVVPPQDRDISSSSRTTLDSVTTSPTTVFPPLTPFTTTSDSDNRHIHNQSPRNPNWGPSRGGFGMGDRKRGASESFLPPKSPKPPKMHKVGKGAGVGGPGAAKGAGKSKNRKKKKKKANKNGQPGPSNLTREEGEVEEDERNDNHAYEGGGVYGGFGFGDEPNYRPAYPHRMD